MKKIEALTKEQESLLSVYRDKWMTIGLCTKRADRPKAEDAVRRCYLAAALTPPEKIIWAASPLSGAILVSILKDEKLMKKLLKGFKAKATPPGASVGDSVRASVGDSVRDSVWASVRASVGDSVRDSVGDSVGASVRDSVRDSVGASVGDSVRASVGDSVRDSVWASVRASVGDSVGDSVRDSVWASVGDSVGASVRASVGDSVFTQHNAGWLGFHNYFREVLNLEKQTEKLAPLMDLSQHSCWIYPYKNICVVTDKPTVVKVNERGRIHSLDGPAVAYEDGLEVYGLDGVRIPKEVFSLVKEKNNPTDVMKIQNAEHRLVAIKYFGIDGIFSALNSKSVDKKKEEYELFSVDLAGSSEKLLKMKNPSEPKFHYEFVPPEIETVNQALAWRIAWNTFKEPKFKT